MFLKCNKIQVQIFFLLKIILTLNYSFIVEDIEEADNSDSDTNGNTAGHTDGHITPIPPLTPIIEEEEQNDVSQ